MYFNIIYAEMWSLESLVIFLYQYSIGMKEKIFYPTKWGDFGLWGKWKIKQILIKNPVIEWDRLGNVRIK